MSSTTDLDRQIERMDERQAVLSSLGDRRARFLLMYRTFKNRLRQNLHDGRFIDLAWSEAICCRMAEMYFEADLSFDADRSACPPPWLHAFGASRRHETNLLQDMLLGMNAHINYDLPVCTYDTLLRFGDIAPFGNFSSEAQSGSVYFSELMRTRYLDYLLINQIAWESIDEIQDAVCARFSPALGKLVQLDRLTSLTLSKRIVEKILCDYRDRAWANTVLLCTASDTTQLLLVKQVASGVAMDAAALVAQLDLRPQQVARHLWFRGHARGAASPNAAVIGLLVDRLPLRATARTAERALIEYGREAHPALAGALREGRGDAQVRGRIERVLAATPTRLAARTLSHQLGVFEGESQYETLRSLSSLGTGKSAPPLEPEPLRTIMAGATARCSELRSWHEALGAGAGGPLLEDALVRRARREVQRVLMARAALGHDRRLYLRARRLDAAPPESAFPAVPPPDGDPSTTFRTLSPGRATRTPESALAEIARSADTWLRVCALRRIGELAFRDLRETVLAALEDTPESVAEAALWSARKLLDEAEFQALAARFQQGARTEALRNYACCLADSERPEERMLSTIEKVLELKPVELFVDVPAEELFEIAGVAEERRFRNGDTLIRAGSTTRAILVVLEGEVDVLRPDGAFLRHVGPHSVLGELSILLDEPRAATCVATSGGRLLRIGAAEFQALLLDYPQIGLGLLRVLARRIRESDGAHAAEPAHR